MSMKRFTLFIVAALIATISFAQKPVLTEKNLPTPFAMTKNVAKPSTEFGQTAKVNNFSPVFANKGMRKAPRKAYENREKLFSDDFESGTLDNWTVVRNGEGTDATDWRTTVSASTFSGSSIPAHSGDYVAMSRSWASTAYSVDNWLISPQVTLGGAMSFWVMDDGQYHEHYDIYISTTDTDLGSFTLLYSPGNASSTWSEVAVDLSAFAGETGYIAIRHQDTDQDYLFIDDFTVFGDEIESPAPANVQVDAQDTDATFTWEGWSDSYTFRYRTTASSEKYFFEALTGAIPEGWTTIDNDGDGNNWYIAGGTLASASYGNGALTPDNWLVTPQLDLQGTLKVNLWGQDPNWADEHFAIYLSTTGNTVEDFTTVLLAETVATGAVTEYSADLSSYAGQKGYIAIRHFNCTDMFRLNVSDFGLYGAVIPAGDWISKNTTETTIFIDGLTPDTSYDYQVMGTKNSIDSDWTPVATFKTRTERLEAVKLPDGVTAETWAFTATRQTGSVTAFNNPNAQLAFDGNDVYFSGFNDYVPAAFIKGTKNADGSLSFPANQYLGTVSGTEYYFEVYNADALNFAFDGELTYTSDNYYSIGTAPYEFNYNDYFSANASISQEVDELVTVPAGIETVVYTMKYKSSATSSSRDAKTYVNVAFDGADVYVQGVWSGLPDAWVKGKVTGDKITFAKKQYLGSYSTQYPNVYFTPFDANGTIINNLVCDYDAESKSFEATDNFAITISKTALTYFSRVYAPLFKEFSANVTAKSAGNPGDPYFATFYDAEEGYVADANTKVYTAKVSESGEWVDLAEVTNKTIPAGNAVVLESNAENIQLAGVIGATGTLSNNDLKGAAADKAPAEGVTTYVLANGDAGVGFYQFAGETLAAGKAYIEIAGDAAAKVLTFGETTAIKGVADVKADDAVIYNLAGQRVNNAQKGIFIQNGKKVVF